MTTSAYPANTPREYTLSVRIPAELRDQLEKLAGATGQTKSFFALEALRERVAHELWDLEQTRLAIAEADRGEFATDDEMKALFAKYGS